jgi:hypothetical protein
MAYEVEKYRDKREKVLGVRKRGMSFGAVAAIVSVCIIAGLGFAIVPKAVSFVTTRNLDDAIYKLENSLPWPKEILPEIHSIQGVEKAATDKNGTRLVITFDRTAVDTGRFTALFKQKGLHPALLNREIHRQRIATLKEEEELEAL